MSGPKLSAYELEQIRKAELERIQRELTASHARIRGLLKDVASLKEWCECELVQFERQLNLLNCCSLSKEKTSETRDIVNLEKQGVIDFLRALEDVRSNPLVNPDELSEVQAEEHRLKETVSDLKRQRDALITKRDGYEASMSGLAENLKDSLKCSTYSLAEALMNISTASLASEDQRDDITTLRSKMLMEIAQLKNNPYASEKDVDRLERAAHLVETDTDLLRLKEIESLVIKELTYKFSKMGSLYEEYSEAICQHNALLVRLGKSPITEEKFETATLLSNKIATLKAENSELYEQIVATATYAEINNSIDEAMRSLGYDLIGAKAASSSGSVKLYQFENGTGIQIVQKDNGNVRLKVVGLSLSNRVPEKSEKEHLVHMQERFCAAYDSIKSAFEAYGIRQVNGSEKLFPPDEQFAQIVDITEYDQSYLQRGNTLCKDGKNLRMPSKRMPIQSPKNLTMED